MGLRPSIEAKAPLVDRYINTSYDVVKAVYDALSQISNVEAALVSIATCNDSTEEIHTVSDSILDVNTLADNIVGLQTIRASLTELLRTYDSIGNIDTVADSIVNVNAVAGDLVEVNAVYNKLTELNAVHAQLTALLAINTNLSKLLDIYTDLAKIESVYDNLAHVQAVSGSIANVNTVSGSISNVNTLALYIDNLNTLYGSITNLNTLHASLTEILLVHGSLANVNTVAGNIANVNIVAGDTTEINSIYDNRVAILTVETNLTQINYVATNIAAWMADFDLLITTPANRNLLQYDSADGKWKNIATTGTGNGVLADSPALTGTPTVPTQAAENNSTAVASTAYVDRADKVFEDLFVDNDDPTGFVDKSDSTISFADGSRTFSIQPTVTSFDYYVSGVKYTSTGDSVVIANTEGIHVVYYDGATLVSVANPTTGAADLVIRTKAIVSYLYWDATNSTAIYVGEERHGMQMSGSTHAYLHANEGLRYLSGLGITNLTVNQNGSSDSHAQFGLDSGAVDDEDIYLPISSIASTEGLPVYFMLGASGAWRKAVNTGFLTHGAIAGRLYYNEWSGSAWQLTEVTDNDFVLYHIFATTEKDNPIVSVMGQAMYANASAARNGALTEIRSLVLDNLLFPEIRPLYTIIFQTKDTYTNAVKARIVSSDEGDYEDWRSQLISRVTLTTSEHNLLTSKQGGTADEYYHLTLAEHTEVAGAVPGTIVTVTDNAADAAPLALGTAAIGVSSKYMRQDAVISDQLPGTTVLGNGTAATTQADNSNSTLVATTAYADVASDSKVADSITDGITTVAPSQNAVFDALALKANLAGAAFTGAVSVQDTSTQLTLKYDVSNTAELSVDTNGYLTVETSGGYIATSDNVVFTGVDTILPSLSGVTSITGETVSVDSGGGLEIDTTIEVAGSYTVYDSTDIGSSNMVAHTGAVVRDRLLVDGSVTLPQLDASKPVFTDGSAQLISNDITGSGNVVMSASPTLTGTASIEALTASGNVTAPTFIGALTGNASTATTAVKLIDGTTDITLFPSTSKIEITVGGTLAVTITAGKVTIHS